MRCSSGITYQVMTTASVACAWYEGMVDFFGGVGAGRRLRRKSPTRRVSAAAALHCDCTAHAYNSHLSQRAIATIKTARRL